MASAGTGMLLDSAVNVSGTTGVITYTVPSGKVFCGQASGNVNSGTITVTVGGAYYANIASAPANGIVLGPGQTITITISTVGNAGISGALFTNP